MFTYPCPNCSLKLNALPERAGQRTMCPKCLRPIVIPSPDDAELELHGGDVDALQPPPEDDALEQLPIHPKSEPEPPIPLKPAPEPQTQPKPASATHQVQPRSAPAPQIQYRQPTPPAPPAQIQPRPAPAPSPATIKAIVTTPKRYPESGKIVFSSSAMTPMDIAAELSAAISTRMKPPPTPPADLRLSTGVWLVLTLGGVLLWLVGIAYDADVLPFAALVGGLQVALGYIWGAYLVGTRNRLRGLLVLIPPVGVFRLFMPYGENGYRPLRFVLSGLLVVAAWTASPKVIGPARTFLAGLTAPPGDAGGPAAGGPADKIRTAAERNQPELLVRQLSDLARPEAVAETPEKDRPAMAAEIAALLKADRADVRAEALKALAVWAPTETRAPTLAALKSSDSGERRAALALAAKWPDAEMAAAVAARLTDRQEQRTAQESLVAMGGPAAEPALLPLLKSEDQLFVLFILDLVEKIGGAKTVDALRELSLTGPSSTVRKEAGQVADVVAARVNGKK